MCSSDLYFWYSNKESDAIDCPNISAVLGGGIARAVSEYPEIFSVEEEKDIRAKIKMIQLGLIEEVKIVSGCTFWNYINGKEGGNDLVHQCFILEGIMQMRQYGDTCEYPWPEGNESKSVDSYKKEDTIYSYSLLQQESEIASLYDLGGMLQYYSDTGAKNDANDVFRFALKTYGDIQDQDAKIEDIREMIFFLKGLSVFSYG